MQWLRYDIVSFHEHYQKILKCCNSEDNGDIKMSGIMAKDLTFPSFCSVEKLKVMCPGTYSSLAGGMPISCEISCDRSGKCCFEIATLSASRLMTYLRLLFKS